MKLVFLGPPGAGKGTMAAKLALELGIPHISTGDIMRAAIRDQTAFGMQVKSILDSGKLVPDDLTNALVKERLQQPDTNKGWILDGFPRTLVQADALATMTTVEAVVNFELGDTEIVKRLSGRRVHKTSGRTYHVLFNPPKVAGKDDISGEDLIQRPDDEESAIQTRLTVYAQQTAPLIQYYSNKKLLHNLDAAPATEKVYESLVKLLKSL